MSAEAQGLPSGVVPDSGAEIWLVRLDESGAALADLESNDPLCSAGELDRIGDAVRRGARMALRRLIARHFGREWAQASFVSGPHGKPTIPGLGGDYNVSHTLAGGAEVALIGVGRVSMIGIDVEPIRTARLDEKRRELIVNAALTAGAGAPLPQKDPARVLQAWARLEAWGKADGRGIGLTLRQFGIWGSSARGHEAVSGPRRDGPSLQVYDIDAGPGLFAAVALPDGIKPPQVRVLPSDAQMISALEGAGPAIANSAVDLASGAGQKGPHRSVAQPG